MAVSWVRSGRSVRLSDVSFQLVHVEENDDNVLAESPSSFVRYYSFGIFVDTM